MAALEEMAASDVAKLRAAGAVVSDEDVVALNDLARRLAHGKDATVLNAPRAARAGSVVLHEPTYAALSWWHVYGRDAFDSTRGQLQTYYFMLAHARRLDVLDGLTTVDKIRAAVRTFMSRVDATEGELWRALLYVRDGSEAAANDTDAPQIVTPSDEDENAEHLYRTLIAASAAVGVAPESLRGETMPTLVSLLIESNKRANIPIKHAVAKEYLAYLARYRAIEKSSKGAANDGGHQ